MIPEKGSVSVLFVALALSGLHSRKMDTAPVLNKAGIAPALLDQAGARVSVPAYAALLRQVAQILDDEFFGLDPRRMRVGSFALACLLALGATDLGGALTRQCRFYSTLFEDLAIGLHRQGRRAALEIRATDPARPPAIFAVETLYVYVHGVACWLVRRRIPILAAEFAYPRPPQAGEYATLFSTQTAFDQPVSRLWFDADHLSLPLVQNADSARAFLNQAPESFLVKYRNPDGMTRRVTTLLRRRTPPDWPDFDTLAASLRCSPATLRRALRQEGTSFQAIKDRLRLDMAQEMLSGTDLSMADIAARLGFAEPSAFTRAFRDWTGLAPARYRRAGSAAAAQGR